MPALKGQLLPSQAQQNFCPTGMCAQHDLVQISRFLGENAYFKYCPTDFLKDHMSQIKHIHGTYVNQRMPVQWPVILPGFPWARHDLGVGVRDGSAWICRDQQPAASPGTWMDASVPDMPQQGRELGQNIGFTLEMQPQ